MAKLLPDGDEPVLLLGVTPELAVIPRRTVAVDWSERMIAVAWPGDCDSRHAVLGDWRALPSRSQLSRITPGWLPDFGFIETRGYPPAERCPIALMDFE